MAEGIMDLDGSNYDDTVKSGVVLVDFWAPWCGPCKMQTPILEKVVTAIGDKAVIAKVNVDENPELAAKYGIRSIPTMVLFRDGKEAARISGAMDSASITRWVEDQL